MPDCKVCWRSGSTTTSASASTLPLGSRPSRSMTQTGPAHFARCPNCVKGGVGPAPFLRPAHRPVVSIATDPYLLRTVLGNHTKSPFRTVHLRLCEPPRRAPSSWARWNARCSAAILLLLTNPSTENAPNATPPTNTRTSPQMANLPAILFKRTSTTSLTCANA